MTPDMDLGKKEDNIQIFLNFLQKSICIMFQKMLYYATLTAKHGFKVSAAK